MHDLGLVNLQAGLRMLVCIPTGMAAGYFIAQALSLPAAVGLTLGTLPAFLTSFIVVDEKATRVAARSAAAFFPFVIALFASLALHELRILELALMVVLLFLQFYASRFGDWAGDFAAVMFGSYVVGLLLPLPIASFEKLAIICAVSLASVIVVRSLLFRPSGYRSLLNTRRAFVGLTSRVISASIDALQSNENNRSALPRLRHRLTQLHNAALVADGLLSRPGVGPTGESAEQLHRLLFDIELAIDGIGRIANDLASEKASAEVRAEVVRALRLILDGGGRVGHTAAHSLSRWCASRPDLCASPRSSESSAIHRLVSLFGDLDNSSRQWIGVKESIPTSVGVPFESPVALFGGRVVGAVPILDATLAGGGMTGPWRRWRVSAALRTAIQAAIAVAIVEPIASALSDSRFYWGVIGVMVVFAGTNSTHERVRKVLNRGVGTVIGGVIGIALVDLLGTTHVWISLLIITLALSIGIYGFMSSYVVWAACLVVAIFQVYAFAPGFTDSLLALRLVENLLGGAIAVIVSTFILPVATGAMIRSAIRRHLEAVRELVTAVGAPLLPRDETLRLRADAWLVDTATFALNAVMKPLWRFSTGGSYRKDEATRTTLVAVSRYAHQLALEASPGIMLRGLPVSDDEVDQARLKVNPAELERITGVFATSVGALIAALDGRHSEQRWEGIGEALEEAGLSDRLHALVRIDEALAGLADRYGIGAKTR